MPPLPSRRVLFSTAALAAVIGTIVCTMTPSSPQKDSEHRLLRERDMISEAALHAESIMNNNLADPATVELRVPEEQAGGPWWDDNLWWQDIDYAVHAQCGVNKCFFQSASHPEHGFVIEPEKKEIVYQLAKAAYLYEKELEASHGIRITSIGRPILVTTPDDFKEHVAEMQKDASRSLVAFYNRIRRSTEVTVQEVHKAPESSVVWRCGETLIDHVKMVIQEGHGETLAEEMELLIPLVEAHPELTWDFQVLIDAEGLIYHIDLSRAMQNLGTKLRVEKLRECLRNQIAQIRSSIDGSGEASS